MAQETQVLVKFVTKLPEELKVPEASVAVPGSLKRYGLSQIINSLLALDPPRPFDFLVNGELLRKNLDQFLLEKQISAERTLEIEYVPAVVPPKHKNAAPHDDWVSCVDGSWGSSTVVSGSYDGNVRLWKAASSVLECTLTISAHPGGINAVVCLPQTQGARLIASAGKDNSLKLWRLNDDDDGETSADCIASYSGHKDAVEGLAASPDGTTLCSSGWDGSMFLWRAGADLLEAAAEATATASKPKKRKGDDAAAATTTAAITEEPLRRLEGHLHCVSSVSYPSNGVIYSGGWDHSVRRWDVETGINTDSYNGSKMVSCVASPSASVAVVAFVGSDKALRVWDTRARQGESLAVQQYISHSAWATSVAWAHGSQHHLATGSHDGSVKLWDLRTVVPLATMKYHTDKVLCVSWLAGAQGHSLASGGADCTLRLFEDN